MLIQFEYNIKEKWIIHGYSIFSPITGQNEPSWHTFKTSVRGHSTLFWCPRPVSHPIQVHPDPNPFTTLLRGHSTSFRCPQNVSIWVHSNPNPSTTLQVPTGRLFSAFLETCQIKLGVRSIKTLFACHSLITLFYIFIMFHIQTQCHIYSTTSP